MAAAGVGRGVLPQACSVCVAADQACAPAGCPPGSLPAVLHRTWGNPRQPLDGADLPARWGRARHRAWHPQGDGGSGLLRIIPYSHFPRIGTASSHLQQFAPGLPGNIRRGERQGIRASRSLLQAPLARRQCAGIAKAQPAPCVLGAAVACHGMSAGGGRAGPGPSPRSRGRRSCATA
jgi:hypothetical protein